MRWPWKKKLPREIGLDTFQRWIEAQRPDFWWFTAQGSMAQEAMATTGSEYVADVANANAQAILTLLAESAGATPKAALATDEASLIAQVAQNFASGDREANGSSAMNLAQALENCKESRQRVKEEESEAGPKTFMGKARDEE